MSDTLLSVEHLSKKFCLSLKRSLWYGLIDIGSELIGNSNCHKRLRKSEFWAIKDISFNLKRGQTMGLIGRNGAGKTTLLRTLNGLIKPDRGCIKVWGRMQALIALGVGFNPVLTGRENIYVSAAVLGIPKKEVDRRFDEILDFSGIEEFIDSPVQNYSSGMLVRLGFSVAIHMEPDILLIDEVLAVGDASYQRKCFSKMKELLKKGTAVILVSHSAPAILSFCEIGLLIENGKMVHSGDIFSVMRSYNNLLDVIESEKSKSEPINNKTRDNLIVDDIKFYDLFYKPHNDNEIPFNSGFIVEISYHTGLRIDKPLIYGEISQGTQLLSVIGGSFSTNGDLSPAVLPNWGKIKFIIRNQALTPGTYGFRLGLRQKDAYFYESLVGNFAIFRVVDDFKIKGFLYNKKFPIFIDSEVELLGG